MFGIDSTEFLVIVIIAVIVIGPKDLPRALYKVGQIVGKAQGMARHFRTGIDAMVREVELEELEKKWAQQNKRIMDEHPPESLPGPASTDTLPAPEAPSHGAETASAETTYTEKPPYVAEAAPSAPAAGDKPPYVAEAPSTKGDAAA
ncbi:sec-independent protein translocase protein TatB [Sphingobium sp. OAS761]|uniref:Sec-independent protein translocase protein TatB n=1 Tax=Sphingobium sp. OAS761 TaxID=2817901 RepID=UPI00209C75D7|nr:Sec-independent protein translocase protein TatB [Sphingobium sp. OAS761]MCP1468564.1 sec-independent protein translocase protein TatB [Sphingobium sp. OAS761]